MLDSCIEGVWGKVRGGICPLHAPFAPPLGLTLIWDKPLGVGKWEASLLAIKPYPMLKSYILISSTNKTFYYRLGIRIPLIPKIN